MSGGRKVSHLAAVAALGGTCVLWATSFASIKICGDILISGAAPGTTRAFGPVLLTAVRFTLAFPIIWIFWKPARSWRPKPADLKPLMAVSVPMAAGFLLQGAGLAFVTATLSGFLTGLCVCFTPALEWLLLGKRPTWRLGVGVALAAAGVAVMTLPGGEGRWSFGLGELLTLAAVLAFTVQIIYTGRSSEKLGAARLTAGSFAFLALCAWASALCISPRSVAGALRAAAASGRFWLYFSIILVCATVGAMTLMNAFQKYVRPSEAAVVYTTEPVFAAVFALIFIGRGELLSAAGMVGAAMMLGANLVVAFKPRKELPPPPGAPPITS